MMQPHTIPNVGAGGCLPVQRMSRGHIAFFCTRERTNQIELCAGIDHPADVAQNSVHLAKCPEAIDINWRETGGLQQQFLVAHAHPRNNFVTFGCLSSVGNLTERNRNHAVASSQIHARGLWSILHTASDYQSAFSNSSETSPGECALASEMSPHPTGASASNSYSRACASQAPGPSLATGMSSDSANEGGEHEEVAKLSLKQIENVGGIETTSLTVVDAVDDRKHSGTAPGACGPERDIFGATNSELSSPDWSVDPQINRGRCAEAGLCADRAQSGSISGDRTTERFSGTTAQRRCVASLARSLLVTAGRDRHLNFNSSETSPGGYALASEMSPHPTGASASFPIQNL